MSRRRSTIHDAAALRLHPNGVRVNDVVQNNLRSVGTVKNRTPSLRLSRKLSRGNWIATDAGGSGRVAKRRKISVEELKEPEAGKSLTADDQGVEAEATRKQCEELPAKVYKDTRANRRVAFKNDLTFLAAPTSVPKDVSPLQPSSDFLKCIHHFASQYYGSRGELFDSAGVYRKVKRENRQRRMLQAAESRSKNPETSQDEGEIDEEGKRADNDSSKEMSPTSKSQRKRKGKEKAMSTQKDMYKAFDGSALLCIGTLLQAHIAASLEDNMPDTWEDDGDLCPTEGSYSSESDSGAVTT
ncbi:hypothetical protein JB92DRAFT_1567549 [Gautieria morchelliformis]|nr:hypothetical protein JB92DRAFT_1567549 [Gautieria morchelliformis]